MAKFIRHNYSAIHEALNKMIVAEVKAALMELPGKAIKKDGDVPLCRIVVSNIDNYWPENVAVNMVTLDAAGELHVFGVSEQYGGCLFDEDDVDMLDITNFAYLIDQIAEKVHGDKTVNLINRAVVVAGMVPELDLKAAIDREI